MRFDDRTTDGQPQANAALAIGRRARSAKELLEDAGLASSRKAGAVVREPNLYLLSLLVGGDLDLATRGRIAYGVFQQIEEYLLQQNTI